MMFPSIPETVCRINKHQYSDISYNFHSFDTFRNVRHSYQKAKQSLWGKRTNNGVASAAQDPRRELCAHASDIKPARLINIRKLRPDVKHTDGREHRRRWTTRQELTYSREDFAADYGPDGLVNVSRLVDVKLKSR